MSEKKIKIGVFIENLNSVDELRDWKHTLFEKLINMDNVELQLLCLTHENDVNINFTNNRDKKEWLFDQISKFEARLFIKEKSTPLSLITQFEKLPKVRVQFTQQNSTIQISDHEIAVISEMKFDILLYHGTLALTGKISTVAKFGIWSLYRYQCDYDYKTLGFWEVYQGKTITSAGLWRLGDTPENTQLIAQGIYNTQYSAVVNRRFVLDRVVNLLIKQINILSTCDKSYYCHPTPTLTEPYSSPNALQLVNYLTKVGLSLSQKIFFHGLGRIGCFRHRCWSLYFAKGAFHQMALTTTQEIKPSCGEFWADPFLVEYNNEIFIFFENYRYKNHLGKISVGKITQQQFELLGDALICHDHLSFPYLFNYNNTIYMMPECAGSYRLALWKPVNFPLHWEIAHTALEGMLLADSTLIEYQGTWWLFTNISTGAIKDFNTELYVFSVDSPLLKQVTPHRQNPVVTDCRTARNGGRPFIKEGTLYRPSQNNSNGTYGYSLNIMKITKLSLQEYEEEMTAAIKPDFKSDLVGCHHLDQSAHYFVLDGCKHRSAMF